MITQTSDKMLTDTADDGAQPDVAVEGLAYFTLTGRFSTAVEVGASRARLVPLSALALPSLNDARHIRVLRRTDSAIS